MNSPFRVVFDCNVLLQSLISPQSPAGKRLPPAPKLIVSRDQDLLSLRDPPTADGQKFAARFPWLEILTPPEPLRRLEASATE